MVYADMQSLIVGQKRRSICLLCHSQSLLSGRPRHQHPTQATLPQMAKQAERAQALHKAAQIIQSRGTNLHSPAQR